ncbi:hypothetical protein D3C78_701620 [compost metagenome]
MEIVQIGNDPLQTCKNSVSVLERKLAEVYFEYCLALMDPVTPVGLGHINLILIRV